MFFMREIFLARKSGMRSSGGGASQSASQSVKSVGGISVRMPYILSDARSMAIVTFSP